MNRVWIATKIQSVVLEISGKCRVATTFQCVEAFTLKMKRRDRSIIRDDGADETQWFNSSETQKTIINNHFKHLPVLRLQIMASPLSSALINTSPLLAMVLIGLACPLHSRT